LNADEGIAFLQQHGILGKSPSDVAQYLYKVQGLSKKTIGEYLGEKNEFNVETLKSFVNLHNFEDVDIVQALRQFLASFHLPGEAQKIDRMMECFAERYCHLNPTLFNNTDVCYILSFSLIMLNTSLHNPKVKDKMSLETFISLNRPVDSTQQLPTEYLTELYLSVKTQPFKVPPDITDATDSASQFPQAFVNPIKQGWLCKRGGRYKSWKRRWFILKDNCLYYFQTDLDKSPKGIIPLENLRLRNIIDRYKSNCFELYSPVCDIIKACKTGPDGQFVPGNHRVFRMSASTVHVQQQWIKVIRASIGDSCWHELQVLKRSSPTYKRPNQVKDQSTTSPTTTQVDF
jgi:cytohesin